jgi:hypothetical protein
MGLTAHRLPTEINAKRHKPTGGIGISNSHLTSGTTAQRHSSKTDEHPQTGLNTSSVRF